MQLINGPYNGRMIEDLGTVEQRMAIYRPNQQKTECGVAVYEPGDGRKESFWSHNVWDGSTLIDHTD